MTPAEQKRAIEREIRRDQRKAATDLVRRLKGAVVDARLAKRQAKIDAKDACKSGREIARARVRALRAELHQAIQQELAAARQACVIGIDNARALADVLAQRRAALEAEKKFQADMRRILRGHENHPALRRPPP